MTQENFSGNGLSHLSTNYDNPANVHLVNYLEIPQLVIDYIRGRQAVLESLGKWEDRIVFTALDPTENIPPIFLLKHPLDVQAVWGKSASALDKTGPFYEAVRRFAGQGLFTMKEDETWQARRTVIGPHLQPKNIAAFGEDVDRLTNQMILQLRTGGVIHDVHTYIKTLSFQITVKTLLGVDAQTDEALRVADSLTKINAFIAANTLMAGLPEWFYRKAPAFLPSTRKAVETLDTYTRQVLSSPTACASPLLAHLIAYGPEQSSRLSEKDLHDEVVTILAAGHGTTASAIAFTLQLLAYPTNRHYQDVIRKDLKRGNKTGALRLVRNAFLEAMRLYPPIYMTSRETTEDIRVETPLGKLAIPKGSCVLISPYLTHRHPQFWTDPETFDPNRFEADRGEKIAYLPFGLGKRRCIGEHFAMNVGSVVLAKMLEQLEFSTDTFSPPLFISTLRPSSHLQLNVSRVE